MIPKAIERQLRDTYGAFEHRSHRSVATAQERAAAEHVSGYRVAKVVVVRLGGGLALAVVAAPDRVDLRPLQEATGVRCAFATETELAERFGPCAPGTAPPLAMFGLPIYVDDKLVRERSIVVPAGSYRDDAVLETTEWLWRERARTLTNLGARRPRHARRGARAGRPHGIHARL